MAVVQEWNDEIFADAIKSGVAMVDFYAVWCGPCRMMAGVLEKAAAEFTDDQVKIGKINIENSKDLAARYNIRTIPTFIVFKNGEVKSISIGVKSQKMLAEAIRQELD